MLSVSRHSYETGECKNIVTGKVILALADLKNEWMNNKKALQFIETASGNTRNATRKKALQLLKELK